MEAWQWRAVPVHVIHLSTCAVGFTLAFVVEVGCPESPGGSGEVPVVPVIAVFRSIGPVQATSMDSTTLRRTRWVKQLVVADDKCDVFEVRSADDEGVDSAFGLLMCSP